MKYCILPISVFLLASCGGSVDFGDGEPGSPDAGVSEPTTARDMYTPPVDMRTAPRDMAASVDLAQNTPDMPRDMYTPPVDMRTTPRDMYTPPVDMGQPPEEDMNVEPVDMGPPPVDFGQPPQGPPPSPSVETVLNQGCTTTIVRGLSEQLIEEMNCIDPGVVSGFDYLQNLNLYSAVFPFLQTPAVLDLDSTVSGQNTLTISSALRTVPQQYLLYRWYQQGRCSISLAARPGRSNHNGAKALDTPDYSAWKSRFQGNSWVWLGSNDPVHFTHSGGKDIRALSVLAFQKLWNRNNPNDMIAEDGDYGPNTESRLKQSPSNGFMTPPWCPASQSYRERAGRISPPTRLVDVLSGSALLELYVPSVVHEVRYATPDDEVFVARHAEIKNFQAVLPLDTEREDVTALNVTTFDASGDELRSFQGVLPGVVPLMMLPEGGGVYRLHHMAPADEAISMVLYVDGERVELDPTSMESGSPFDLLLSLREQSQELLTRRLEVVLLDRWHHEVERTQFELLITY